MKYILTGDWHYRSTNPTMRIDNYNQVMLEKIAWIVRMTNEEGAVLLNAGDVFDSPRIGFEALNNLIDTLSNLGNPMVMVRGNHDTHFHSKDTRNTPYNTLISAGVAIEPPQYSVAGLGWEDEDPGEGDVLLAHAQVYEGEPPHYMPDALSANDFIRKYPGHGYYCVGDIHIPCYYRNLIVPGSIMRMTSAQVDYKPAVWFLDTDTDEVEQVFIPINNGVFDTDKIDRRKDSKDLSDEAISVFVESIDCKVDKPDYVKNLDLVLAEAKPNKDVKQVVSTIMESVG